MNVSKYPALSKPGWDFRPSTKISVRPQSLGGQVGSALDRGGIAWERGQKTSFALQLSANRAFMLNNNSCWQHTLVGRILFCRRIDELLSSYYSVITGQLPVTSKSWTKMSKKTHKKIDLKIYVFIFYHLPWNCWSLIYFGVFVLQLQKLARAAAVYFYVILQ